MPRILVVDDEVAIRFVLQEFLSELGFTVEIAADGQEALGAMEKEPPALILLDLQMPVMSGRQLLDAMQTREKLRAIPVILISGVAGSADYLPSKGLYQALIKKPFGLEEIESKVRQFV